MTTRSAFGIRPGGSAVVVARLPGRPVLAPARVLAFVRPGAAGGGEWAGRTSGAPDVRASSGSFFERLLGAGPAYAGADTRASPSASRMKPACPAPGEQLSVSFSTPVTSILTGSGLPTLTVSGCFHRLPSR